MRGKKHRRALGLFGLLVILAMLAIILNFSELKPQDTLYIAEIDLGKEIYRDQVERLVFITTDLRIFIFTTSEHDRVGGPVSQLYEYLQKRGVSAVDIALIVHNHFIPTGFSPPNNKTYHFFKDRGFTGKYSIYYPASGKTRTKKDE